LALIPEEKIAEIRDRTDIVQVIGEYIALKRAGNSHKGLCPFHNEKTPSFNVIPSKQFFHCFGCGKSGDVISFLREIEGKSFIDVARDLAKRSGVDLPEPPRSAEAIAHQKSVESERARLVRLHELSAEFYRAQLEAPVGANARAYVEKRGISTAVQEQFKVGYAPAGWEALTKHFEAKKVPHELAERSGLVRRRERAGQVAPGTPPSTRTHYDSFVDRVVYALTSPMGETIGFGGRILEAKEDQPKYKNSPETLIYKKGENLFGLHIAKHAIRKTGRALVVEGNFDVMTLHDRGVDYTVAPQGTAITDAQVALLQRFAREVVLMLDADPAGRAATLKVIRLFADANLPCRVAQLRAKDGKKVDPDDLARNDLPRLQKLIDDAVDAIEFFFDQVAATAAPTVPGKVAAVEECAPLLRSVRDPLARDLYIERLANLLKIDPRSVRKTLLAAPQMRDERPAPEAESSPAPSVPVVQPREIAPPLAKLVALLGAHATLWARMSPTVLDAIPDAQVRALMASGATEAHALVGNAAEEIRASVVRALANDELAGLADDGARRMFDDIVGKLRLPTDLDALKAERAQAIASNDLARVRELTARILKLSRLPGHA
jgi:DNA primase